MEGKPIGFHKWVRADSISGTPRTNDRLLVIPLAVNLMDMVKQMSKWFKNYVLKIQPFYNLLSCLMISCPLVAIRTIKKAKKQA
jgi:hypothetical protein